MIGAKLPQGVPFSLATDIRRKWASMCAWLILATSSSLARLFVLCCRHRAMLQGRRSRDSPGAVPSSSAARKLQRPWVAIRRCRYEVARMPGPPRVPSCLGSRKARLSKGLQLLLRISRNIRIGSPTDTLRATVLGVCRSPRLSVPRRTQAV